MFNKKREGNKAEDKNSKHSGYVNWWLFRDRGTVAEKRTIKELWNDPEVQKEIDLVRSTFKTKAQSDN